MMKWNVENRHIKLLQKMFYYHLKLTKAVLTAFIKVHISKVRLLSKVKVKGKVKFICLM